MVVFSFQIGMYVLVYEPILPRTNVSVNTFSQKNEHIFLFFHEQLFDFYREICYTKNIRLWIH